MPLRVTCCKLLSERMFDLFLQPSWISMHSAGLSFSPRALERAATEAARWICSFYPPVVQHLTLGPILFLAWVMDVRIPPTDLSTV